MAHYKGSASEGNRAANLIKKREKQREELERMKQKIAEVRFSCNSGLSHCKPQLYAFTAGALQVCGSGKQVC